MNPGATNMFCVQTFRIVKVSFTIIHNMYRWNGWWKTSCTSWYVVFSHYLQGFTHPRWVQGFFHQQYLKKMKRYKKYIHASMYILLFIFAHFYAFFKHQKNPSVLQQRGHRPSAEGLVGDLAYSGRPKPRDRSGMSWKDKLVESLAVET